MLTLCCLLCQDLGQYDPRSNNRRSAPGQLDPRTGKRKAPAQLRDRDAQRAIWASNTSMARSSAKGPNGSVYRPRLVVGEDEDGHAETSAVNQAERTFGQRAQNTLSGVSNKSSRSGREVSRDTVSASNNDLIRATSGGGMEYSFVPTTTSANDVDDDTRLQRKNQRMEKQTKDHIAAGKFGSGLEKGSGVGENARAQARLGEEDRSGRTKMRRVARSASKNVTRGL